MVWLDASAASQSNQDTVYDSTTERLGDDDIQYVYYGSNVALWCIHKNHPDLLSRLLGHGLDINLSIHRPSSVFATLLHYSVISRAARSIGDTSITRLLLKRGANPSASWLLYSMEGCTPLHWVTQYKGPGEDNADELIKLLVEYGADIEAPSCGHTMSRHGVSWAPLEAAIDNCNSEAVRVLVEMWAWVDPELKRVEIETGVALHVMVGEIVWPIRIGNLRKVMKRKAAGIKYGDGTEEELRGAYVNACIYFDRSRGICHGYI